MRKKKGKKKKKERKAYKNIYIINNDIIRKKIINK